MPPPPSPRMISLCLFWLLSANSVGAFTSSHISAPFGIATSRSHHHPSWSLLASTKTVDASTSSPTTNDDHDNMAIRAPLKFIGPYPSLGLRFPHLATSSQRQRGNNVTGVSLDFVLDTAANTNTINAQVAQELNLTVVGMALPGVGAGGAMAGAETYMLGDAQLEGVGGGGAAPKDDDDDDETNGETTEEEEEEEAEDGPFTFMSELTASALPVASPAAAGLLSTAFFYCFEGGVEFDWGAATIVPDKDDSNDKALSKVPPSVTFHGGKNKVVQDMMKDMQCVPITELPTTRLPTVQIQVNGVTMPALLDTGSPITVLNAQAAQQAGIETITTLPGGQGSDKKKKSSNNNPLAAMANKFKEAQAAAQAAQRGDVLTLASSNGQPIQLLKSTDKAAIGAVTKSDDDTVVDFGSSSNIYVGDLPGLAALNGLGDTSPPAAVLGMDVLRTRPKMLLRFRNQEVYF